MSGISVRVERLTLRHQSRPFDLEIRSGSITGLTGLERAGQEELLQTLCGLCKPITGTLRVFDKDFGAKGLSNIREAFKYGIAYLPRERKTEGILSGRSVLDNFGIATLHQYSTFGVLNTRRLRREYDRFARQLGIVSASPDSAIRTLSGGNQQKVLLARWLAAAPKVLLLNDPSRGVDQPTKQAMHDIYRVLANAGTSVILLSSEIEELLSVANSILVFRDGNLEKTLSADSMSRHNVLGAMFGVDVE